MKTNLTRNQISAMFARMWLRTLLGALLAIVIAKPLADWAYMNFEFLRYHPTITVDHRAQVVTPLRGPNNASASPAAPARSAR
jgi:hypothetical protein